MIYTLCSSWLLYIILPLLAYYVYTLLTSKKYKLPPGPKPWPIIGSIPDPYSAPLMYKQLMDKWVKEYGDVILFKRFGMNFVYVNDYKLGTQAFAVNYPKELAGRPTNGLDRLSVGDKDIFFTKSMGPEFTELRKQVMIMLRKSAEPNKMFEISNTAYDLFASHIKEKKSLVKTNGFYVEPLCYWLGHNLLTQVFWRDAVVYEDEEFQDSMGIIKKLMDDVGNKPLLANYLQRPIDLDSPLKENDFVLPNKAQIAKQKTGSLGTKFSIARANKYPHLPLMDDFYISNLSLDIYFAGMDAFGIGFSWTIGLLAKNPFAQDKIRAELQNLGEKYNESFQIKWIDEMHYTNAVISEVMRIHSLSSFTSFHRAMDDAKVGEYDIPKETIIVLNIYGAHFDPRYWKEPEKFNPERFIDENGKYKLPKEGFMPFGTGRRICVAERYTVKESHAVFTARICQDFNIIWSKSNGNKDLEEDMENNFFRHTAPFDVEFKPIN